jgi:hypothetical protein
LCYVENHSLKNYKILIHSLFAAINEGLKIGMIFSQYTFVNKKKL